MEAGKPGYRKTTLFVYQLWRQHEARVSSDKVSHLDIDFPIFNLKHEIIINAA